MVTIAIPGFGRDSPDRTKLSQEQLNRKLDYKEAQEFDDEAGVAEEG